MGPDYKFFLCVAIGYVVLMAVASTMIAKAFL